MAGAQFDREELEAIESRAKESALEAEDAGLRAALQVLAESARNVAVKLPGGETPDPFEDSASA